MLHLTAKIKLPKGFQTSTFENINVSTYKSPVFKISDLQKLGGGISQGILKNVLAVFGVLTSIFSFKKITPYSWGNVWKTHERHKLYLNELDVIGAKGARWQYRLAPEGTAHMFRLEYLNHDSPSHTTIKTLNPDSNNKRLINYIYKQFLIAHKREERFKNLHKKPLPTFGVGKYRNKLYRMIRNTGYYFKTGLKQVSNEELKPNIFNKLLGRDKIGNVLIYDAIPNLNKLYDRITDSSIFLGKVIPNLSLIIGIVAILLPLIKAFIGYLGVGAEKFSVIYNLNKAVLSAQISQELYPAMKFFFDALVYLINQFKIIIQSNLPLIKAFIYIISAIIYALSTFLIAYNTYYEIFKQIFFAIIDSFELFGSLIMDFTGFIYHNIGHLTNYIIQWIKDIFNLCANNIKPIFMAFIDVVKEAYYDLLFNMFGSKKTPALSNSLTTLKESIINSIEEKRNNDQKNWNDNIIPILDSGNLYADKAENTLEKFVNGRKKAFDLIAERAHIKEKAKTYDLMILKLNEKIHQENAEYEFSHQKG